MAVDGAAYAKALEVPEVTVPRRWPFRGVETLRGRILSHAEWVPFQERAESLRGASARELTDFLASYLKAVGIPPKAVLNRLPTGAVLEVLDDFLALQRDAMEPRHRRTRGRRGRA